MSNGTLQQISAALSAKKGGAEKKANQAETEFLLSMRNDKTNADEAVIWTRFILWVLTAFVVYLGFNYYLSTFSEMFPYPVAVLFALALPLVVEVGKIRLASKMLRSWWFGWINDGVYTTLYWAFVAILAGGCYWWSYTISTGGIKEVAKQNATAKNKQDDFQVVIGAACMDVDARISAINQKDSEAGKMKTKKGNIAWSGQSIKMENAKTLASLQKEREAIVSQTTASYITQEGENVTKVSKWSSFIERFGGWGEFGTAVCLVIISFFEKRLFLLNKDALPKEQVGPKVEANPTNFHSNGHPVQNASSPSPADPNLLPIQFHWNGYGQKPVQPVTHPHTPVSQPTQLNPVVIGSNQILQRLRTKLQADIPNLIKKNGVPATVSNRITKAFEECYEAMDNPDFKPSRQVAAMVYGYLAETAIPSLNGVGHPYEHDARFMQRLMKVIPQAHTEA